MWDSRGHEVASARVGVAVDGSSLRLKPDVAMPENPATRFPVVVDPDMAAWNQSMMRRIDIECLRGNGGGNFLFLL